MNKVLLVVGGCGFIGTNLLEMVLEQDIYRKVIVWDKFTYAANEKRIRELEEKHDNLTVVAMHADDWEHCQNEADNLEKLDGIDWHDLHVINLASSSHVDRSIQGPLEFVGDNCVSACNLLELLRQRGFGDRGSSSRMVHISTDEANCTCDHETGSSSKKEEDPIRPNSPYSAMKAAAENMCRAYQKTYNFPVTVTRCGNNYGSYQHWEKFIPTICGALKQGRKIPVYGDGRNIRTWVDVKEHCSVILWLLNHAYWKPQIVHIGGLELSNMEVVKYALEEYLERSITDQDLKEHVEFVEDRKGHDLAYLIDDNKLKDSSYEYKHTSLQGFLRNLRHYLK